MAPVWSQLHQDGLEALQSRAINKAKMSIPAIILEAWAEGFYVGALVILMFVVLCNIRRGVVLHKLILLEMACALLHGTFIFLDDPVYGWYLSATATFLFISYQIHNIVAFLKIRSFLPRWGRWTYLISLALVQPFWIVEIYDNFAYFNLGSDLNTYTRPWEAAARDPWWIFTTFYLFYKIKVGYEMTVARLFKASPRFGMMTICMILSIAFLLADIIVTAAPDLSNQAGINPYWRLTLVFKCASDTIFLDDFKSVLDAIVTKRFRRFRSDGQLDHGTHSQPSRKRSIGELVRIPHGMFKTPTYNKSQNAEHLDLERSKTTESQEIILQHMPAFPDGTVTFERKVEHEEAGSDDDKPAYDCNVSASHDFARK